MEKKNFVYANLLNVDPRSLAKEHALPPSWYTKVNEKSKRAEQLEKTRKYFSMQVVSRYIENMKGLVASSKLLLRKPDAAQLKKLQ